MDAIIRGGGLLSRFGIVFGNGGWMAGGQWPLAGGGGGVGGLGSIGFVYLVK